MERGGGRSPDERRAAADARARARGGREDDPDEERIDEEPARRSPEGRPMSRHYGGEDVYGRRRLFGAAAIVALIFVLFLLLQGC
jgi:hypothetical protein